MLDREICCRCHREYLCRLHKSAEWESEKDRLEFEDNMVNAFYTDWDTRDTVACHYVDFSDICVCIGTHATPPKRCPYVLEILLRGKYDA